MEYYKATQNNYFIGLPKLFMEVHAKHYVFIVLHDVSLGLVIRTIGLVSRIFAYYLRPICSIILSFISYQFTLEKLVKGTFWPCLP